MAKTDITEGAGATDERKGLALAASWELEGLGQMLLTQAKSEAWGLEPGVEGSIRCIALRVRQLSHIIVASLDDTQAQPAALQAQLEGRSHG
jgi:hypothetical protein